MADEVKPGPNATAKEPENKGLETWTPEQLKGLYDKTPEIFEKAGIPLQKKEAAASGEKEKPKEGAAQPAGLELKLPDGVPVDKEALEKFRAIMGDEKLTVPQKAQKLIDLQGEEYRKSVETAKQREARFDDELKKIDPDFAKDFNANIELSKQGLVKFDKTGEVAKRLVEIGAHKDPVLARYFRDVGRASSEAETKRPEHRPNKEAETEQDAYRARYDKSPEMFVGEPQSQ